MVATQERRISDNMSDNPEVEVVTLDELVVDDTYQRELNQKLVERIMGAWDEMAADALTVSKRDNGKLYLVNGQHRAAAAKLNGVTEMLAIVHTGLSVAEEAELRLKSNHRRPDTPLERFHAQVAAEAGQLGESTLISMIAEQFDTQINKVVNKTSGINAIATVEQIFRMDGDGTILRQVFDTLRKAYGPLGGEHVGEYVMKGTAYFIKNHWHDTRVNHAEFRKRIEVIGIDEITRKARAHKSALGGSLAMNYYRALVEMWNYKRLEKNRIEWKTTSEKRRERPEENS